MPQEPIKKNSIFARLIDFQSKVEPIKKNATNPFFKKTYATLDAIQFAIQKPLADAGLGYMQEATSEGLKTTLFDLDGNTKESIYPAVFSGKSQEVGSSLSYAKRYALTALLGLIIEGEDDDGNKAQESKNQSHPPKNVNWLTQDQFEQLKKMISANTNIEGVKATIKKYSGQTLEGVTFKMKKDYKIQLTSLLNQK